MTGIIIVALVLLGVFVRGLTPPERLQLFHRILAAIRHARKVLTQVPRGCEAFFEMLRQRTHRVVVTPTILGLIAAIFVVMCVGAGAFSEPGTLLGWGGSFGPRTTNGEWWRLVTAMFVHSGMLHVVANVAGLAWIGFMVERLVGPVAFAATYLTAGLLAGLAGLSAHQAAVNVGSSGAIFGMYGLLFASMIWGLHRRSTATIPLVALKGLAPGAAVFLLYDLMTQGLYSEARFVGFVAGLGSGLILAAGVSQPKPARRRVATVAVATIAIVVIWAVQLRGLADVAPEIGQVIAVEYRTARDYDAALARYNDGRGTLKERIDLINHVRPELQALQARLESLDRVPREHQPMVATAIEYLKARDESWRLRAEALRKGNMRLLRDADTVERASLEGFHRIQLADVD